MNRKEKTENKKSTNQNKTQKKTKPNKTRNETEQQYIYILSEKTEVKVKVVGFYDISALIKPKHLA